MTPSIAPINISSTSITRTGPERGYIDVVGVAMQRQQRGRKDERESEPHARRNILLAQARQQHQHGADAREHQRESGAKRRQE